MPALAAVGGAGTDPETLGLLLAGVRRLVDEKLIPVEAEADAGGEIPADAVGAMRALGLFGLNVPAEYGGLGLGMAEEAQVMFELCRASPAFRSVLGTTVGVGGKAIRLDGTAAQRERWLPAIAEGRCIVSFCLTEPDAGSDAASLRTRAVRDGDAYVLNGSKRFISNAPIADLFVVMARTGPQADGAGGVSAFLVEKDTRGLSVGPPLRKMGQRGAHTADVDLDDCRIPAGMLIGGREGEGFRTAMRALDEGRIHMAACAVGASIRLVEEMVAHARTRRQFGRPIGDFQLVQAMLADSEAELGAARAMVERVAAARDRGEAVTRAAASAKYFSAEALWRIADRAVQVHGGYGYVSETAVERLFRDARLFRIYEGTSQIMQLVIARDMLKED